MKTKRWLSFLLVVVMVFAMSTNAFAVNTTGDLTFASNYESFNLISNPSSMNLYDVNRTNPANALGTFDAVQNGSTDKFFSVGYAGADGVTYTFGTNMIAKNGDTSINGGYDAGVSEVTWGSWHKEAVDVFLVGAKLAGEATVRTDPFKIGTIFNKVGIDANLDTGGLDVKEEIIDNFGVTWFNFPDNVEYARAIKLVDVTDRYNSGYTAYRSSDGYDLDAIFAFSANVVPEPIQVTAKKFIDIAENGLFDSDDYYTSGFSFTATKGSEVRNATSDANGVINFGMFDADDIGTWAVVETSKMFYHQTNYLNGTSFEITNTGDALSVDWADDSNNVEFGNAPDAYNPGAAGTAWGGWKTSTEFPKYNKGTGEYNDYNGVYRTGSSAWAMAIKYNGEVDLTRPLIAGQYTTVGYVTISKLSDTQIKVTYVMNPVYTLIERHCGAYDSLGEIPNNNGHLYGELADGVYTFDYTSGSTVYIAAHCVVE